MVKNYDDMLSRFHLIPESIGQTDRPTDKRTACYINIARAVSVLTRDKKETRHLHQGHSRGLDSRIEGEGNETGSRDRRTPVRGLDGKCV